MGFRQSENLVYHNTKAKIYPDGQQKIMVCSKPIFKSECWEQVDKYGKEKVPVPKPKDMSNEVRGDSLKRAKEACFDIAFCNDFTWFITWTLNKEEIDRYNPDEVSKKLRTFLNNKVKRNSARYIIIPEYHADGKGIHMHGLLTGDFLMKDSGKCTQSGKTIYNMPQWKYGWSTAIELDGSKVAVAKYITKYITKDFKKIFGSFYYAGGKGLIRKPQVQLFDSDFNAVKVDKIFKPSEWNVKYKYIDVDEQAALNSLRILQEIGEIENGTRA
ncbi:rolling circle replication-associated protein [Clostridium minihomine]|uniref:rolling circle replication-associated protein n=1 Tax=Clostridium minihomine TaxID=2045012 RepID=UPI000C758CE5|nr:hypothetical protein [Clostridium minihomine]